MRDAVCMGVWKQFVSIASLQIYFSCSFVSVLTLNLVTVPPKTWYEFKPKTKSFLSRPPPFTCHWTHTLTVLLSCLLLRCCIVASHDLCPLSLLPVCTCSWENAIHQLCYILGFPYLSQIAVDTSLTEQICNDSVSMFWQILTPSAKLGFCMHSEAFNRSFRLLWLILPWYWPVGKTINLPCQVTKSKIGSEYLSQDNDSYRTQLQTMESELMQINDEFNIKKQTTQVYRARQGQLTLS